MSKEVFTSPRRSSLNEVFCWICFISRFNSAAAAAAAADDDDDDDVGDGDDGDPVQ